jgi:membrane-associated phospholipid phosphatase
MGLKRKVFSWRDSDCIKKPDLNGSHREYVIRSILIGVSLTFFLVVLPSNTRGALLRGLSEHRYIAGMLFCFGLLALSLLWSTGQSIDAWVFSYFNLRGKHPLWLDRLMLGFTQLGNGIFALIVALILFFMNLHRLAYEVILGTLTLWLLVEIFKTIVHRSRPYIKVAGARIVGPLEHRCSFPSGHTSQVFFMATLLYQYFHPQFWVAFFLFGLAVFVAITRMYVGAHYPRDVLAGFIVGTIWSILGVIVDTHFLVAIR